MTCLSYWLCYTGIYSLVKKFLSLCYRMLCFWWIKIEIFRYIAVAIFRVIGDRLCPILCLVSLHCLDERNRRRQVCNSASRPVIILRTKIWQFVVISDSSSAFDGRRWHWLGRLPLVPTPLSPPPTAGRRDPADSRVRRQRAERHGNLRG